MIDLILHVSRINADADSHQGGGGTESRFSYESGAGNPRTL